MSKKKWSNPELTNLSVKKTETSDNWIYTETKEDSSSGDSSDNCEVDF